jgi:hypothetical protein
LNEYTKHEIKSCPRCGSTFECKPGNITQCQCYAVAITKDEAAFIKEIYDDCLCANCLIKMKQIFKEKQILAYYSSLKSDKFEFLIE